MPDQPFDIAVLSDVGTNRADNEDSCGFIVDDAQSVIFAVADGIGGYEGGEIASAMAIEVTLQGWRESPVQWGAAKRLARAVQRANIEIHNRALTVPELRRMGTTLTAVAIEGGMLSATHVGDCRLYLIRGSKVVQLSKDHTAVAERVRMGILSEEAARTHPERSTLTRSLGHDLIVSVDRISMPLIRDDRIVLCTDGLHNVLPASEIRSIILGKTCTDSCRDLIDAANERGTADNLTSAVFHMKADTGLDPTPTSLVSKIRAWVGRSGS